MNDIPVKKVKWEQMNLPEACRILESKSGKAVLFKTDIGCFWFPKKLVRNAKEFGNLTIAFPPDIVIRLKESDDPEAKTREVNGSAFIMQLREHFLNQKEGEVKVVQKLFESDDIPF